MEIIMEDQIKLDNQVAQYAPILEQGQVGQVLDKCLKLCKRSYIPTSTGN